MKQHSGTLIIGVGNPYRCDDGAGVMVARRMRGIEQDLRIVEASGEGAGLIELWQQAANVVIVDAVCSAGPPGQVYFIDAVREEVPRGFFNYSTHNFGLAEAVELSRVLGRLPPQLGIYGIVGKNFGAGSGLSPEVYSAIDEVVARILQQL